MKYLKSLTLKMCVIAAALLLASPAVAVNSNGRGTKVKTVYQDTDPSATNYLKNRRALVGPGCTVNSVGAGVKVASDLEIFRTCVTTTSTTMFHSRVLLTQPSVHRRLSASRTTNTIMQRAQKLASQSAPALTPTSSK